MSMMRIWKHFFVKIFRRGGVLKNIIPVYSRLDSRYRNVNNNTFYKSIRVRRRVQGLTSNRLPSTRRRTRCWWCRRRPCRRRSRPGRRSNRVRCRDATAIRTNGTGARWDRRTCRRRTGRAPRAVEDVRRRRADTVVAHWDASAAVAAGLTASAWTRWTTRPRSRRIARRQRPGTGRTGRGSATERRRRPRPAGGRSRSAGPPWTARWPGPATGRSRPPLGRGVSWRQCVVVTGPSASAAADGVTKTRRGGKAAADGVDERRRRWRRTHRICCCASLTNQHQRQRSALRRALSPPDRVYTIVLCLNFFSTDVANMIIGVTFIIAVIIVVVIVVVNGSRCNISAMRTVLCSSPAPNVVTMSYSVRGPAMTFGSVLPPLPGASQLPLSPRPLTVDVAASSPLRRVPPAVVSYNRSARALPLSTVGLYNCCRASAAAVKLEHITTAVPGYLGPAMWPSPL